MNDDTKASGVGETEREALRDPTPQELESPEFNAVWNAIKKWDISRTSNGLYAGATGTDVCTILDALKGQARSAGDAPPPRCHNCEHLASRHQPHGYGGCSVRIATSDGDDYCPCNLDANEAVVDSGAIPAQPKVEAPKQRGCNRHNDCDAADAKWLAAHPEEKFVPFSFHCHDDECEDCFGC